MLGTADKAMRQSDDFNPQADIGAPTSQAFHRTPLTPMASSAASAAGANPQLAERKPHFGPWVRGRSTRGLKQPSDHDSSLSLLPFLAAFFGALGLMAVSMPLATLLRTSNHLFFSSISL